MMFGRLEICDRLYKIKHAANGHIEKYKPKFVGEGFSQKEGVDYEETIAPIAKHTSIKVIMSTT
jgi:hypothetical protein